MTTSAARGAVRDIRQLQVGKVPNKLRSAGPPRDPDLLTQPSPPRS